MNSHFLRPSLALLAVLACSTAHAAIHDFDGYAAVSDDALDTMRGGFEIDFNGMQLLLAFSLERLTYVNGELVSSTKLTPLQLIGANVPPATPGTPVAAAPPGSRPPDPVAAATDAGAPPRIVTTQLANNQAVITLVQNGSGNSFTLPESLSSLATVIQNTVNDQVIRNLTVLNATLSIKAAATAMQLGSALNQAIAASAR